MYRLVIASVFVAAFFAPVTSAHAQSSDFSSLAAVPMTAPAAGIDPWTVNRPAPASLKVLFGSYAALQGLDVYSTALARKAGAREANPLMNTGTMQGVALKSAMGAITYYAVNRMAKSNRKGAVVMMIVLNGVTGAVVAHNIRNSRR